MSRKNNRQRAKSASRTRRSESSASPQQDLIPTDLPPHPEPQDRSTPRSLRWAVVVMCLTLGFVVVQLILPLSPFLVEPHTSRTDFSWDMFAVRRDCERCMLTQSVNGSPAKKIGWGNWFRSPYHVARSRNQQRLPLLAREFCREHQERVANLDVRIVCECRYNKSETLYNLDPFGDNYCSAEAAQRFD